MANHKDLEASPVKMPAKATLTYAVELECDEPNTRHFKHIWCHERNGGKLAEVPPGLPKGQLGTIPNMVANACQQFASKPCMGTRRIHECRLEGKKQFWWKGPVEWRTYEQVSQDIAAAARGITGLPGIKALRESGQCVAAILADTSADWQISAQAVFRCGMTVTTVYTTLGHEAMLHGLNQTEAAILFIDWSQYHTLLGPVLSKCQSLRHIVLIGKCFVPLTTIGGESKAFPSAKEAAELPPAGINTCTLEGLITSGSQSTVDLTPFAPKPDDLAFIMYTSGSTGLPKGVMLTHKNFVALIASIIAQELVSWQRDGDIFIAFLPLAHILELMVETCTLVQGAAIAYSHARTVTPSSPYIHPSNAEGCDLLAIRPSLMVAVPSILEAIRNGLNQKLQKMEGLKGKLVRGAISQALGQKSDEGSGVDCVLTLGLGKLMHAQVKKGLGLDRLKMIISGGAPLSPETQDWIVAVLAPVAQGYGATETTGCTTVQECISSGGRQADSSTGLVGAIQPACEVKLVSVPDMGYNVTDDPPRGEILVSGNTVSQQGYFKMEEKSQEDFPVHSDGKVWFHTGDVGEMSKLGTLRIIDRKKDLIKLSGGEYVSLGKVESALKQVAGVGAVVVFARSDKDHCVAIVSEPERGWASVGGRPDEDKLVTSIEMKLRSLGLARFEIPTKVRVDESVWTPETGLVTASMKIQRNAIREYYNASGGLLEAMDYRFEQK